MKARINEKEYREEIKKMSQKELLNLKVALVERKKMIEKIGAVDEGIEQKIAIVDELAGNVQIDKATADLFARN